MHREDRLAAEGAGHFGAFCDCRPAGKIRGMKRKLFAPTEFRQGAVVLNWHGTPQEEFGFFANAFHAAAKELVRPVRENPRFGLWGAAQDFQAYPVVFMYRHALELHMKAVLIDGSSMLVVRRHDPSCREPATRGAQSDVSRPAVGAHLRSLWSGVGISVLITFEIERTIRKLIGEFSAADDKSFAFRYPVNTKGKASLPPDFTFDLVVFCETLDGLLNALDGAKTAAREQFEAHMELEAEARQYEMENYEPSDPIMIRIEFLRQAPDARAR